MKDDQGQYESLLVSSSGSSRADEEKGADK
jgi:hypothetical protein